MFHKVYSYLFTDFFRILKVSLLETRYCLIHIYILHNLKQYIRCTFSVTSIVTAATECLILYVSDFLGSVDHSYVYKFTQ